MLEALSESMEEPGGRCQNSSSQLCGHALDTLPDSARGISGGSGTRLLCKGATDVMSGIIATHLNLLWCLCLGWTWSLMENLALQGAAPTSSVSLMPTSRWPQSLYFTQETSACEKVRLEPGRQPSGEISQTTEVPLMGR